MALTEQQLEGYKRLVYSASPGWDTREGRLQGACGTLLAEVRRLGKMADQAIEEQERERRLSSKLSDQLSSAGYEVNQLREHIKGCEYQHALEVRRLNELERVRLQNDHVGLYPRVDDRGLTVPNQCPSLLRMNEVAHDNPERVKQG